MRFSALYSVNTLGPTHGLLLLKCRDRASLTKLLHNWCPLISLLRVAEAWLFILICWVSLFHSEEYLMVKRFFLSVILDMGTDTENSVCCKPYKGLFLTWGVKKHTYLPMILWKSRGWLELGPVIRNRNAVFCGVPCNSSRKNSLEVSF